MIIKHASGLAGAATATGAAIVIDVFRAFSAAAYAFDAGAVEIVLTAEVDEARDLAASIPESILMGEVDGVRPHGFVLGNSPGEVAASPHLVEGRTIVHRSSAGTRCALAALDSGAAPLYVASLVVASATAAAVVDLPEVTLISSGLSGAGVSEEDAICAHLLAGLLQGSHVDPAASAEAVVATDRAGLLSSAAFAHPDDVRLCCAVDRFSFAMPATAGEGIVTVRPVPAG